MVPARNHCSTVLLSGAGQACVSIGCQIVSDQPKSPEPEIMPPVPQAEPQRDTPEIPPDKNAPEKNSPSKGNR